MEPPETPKELGAESFQGLRVVAFESRMAAEIKTLIGRFGGIAITAPSMREVPLEDHRQALDFAQGLVAGEFDVVIFLTGVGVRQLFRVMETRFERPNLLAALSRLTTMARGPKPERALRELGFRATLTAPDPATWHEVISVLTATSTIQGKRIAVQEYGASNDELRVGLERLGARVTAVPIYRWAMPLDDRPLKRVLQSIVAGEADVVLFTNANQIANVMHLARAEGIEELVRHGLNAMAVCSVGPDCSTALRGCGIGVDHEPAHPRMGHLVKEAARQSAAILQRKRDKS
ncbi:MAG TPA: uroporphyrinogen-III synthase [Candidatus Binataceae bacterium]|nr:uroporphyrinogen-III synthase [Candidatus Binataceae bacterium]